MEFKDYLKTTRKNKHITQKELSKQTGIAEITIRQYEAGKYLPKFDNLKKLMKALNVEWIDLLEAVDDTPYSDPTADDLPFFSPTDSGPKDEYNLARILTGPKTPESERTTSLLFSFSLLNEKGQNKVIGYSRDLEDQPKFRKDSDTEESPGE